MQEGSLITVKKILSVCRSMQITDVIRLGQSFCQVVNLVADHTHRTAWYGVVKSLMQFVCNLMQRRSCFDRY